MTNRTARTRFAAASVSVVLASAALSLATASGAAAASDEQGGLLGSVLTSVDDTLGGTLDVLPPVLSDVLGDATGSVLPRTGDDGGSKAKSKGLLGDTVAGIRNTSAELPLLGPALSGTVDELGGAVPALDPSPAKTESKPAKSKPGASKAGPIQGAEAVRGPGVTWTMPMMTGPDAVTPVVNEVQDNTSGGGNSGPVGEIINNFLNILPSTAVGVAQVGVGAATVALIVLGGIAITGAAGAASVVGRRDLAGTTAGAGTLGGILR